MYNFELRFLWIVLRKRLKKRPQFSAQIFDHGEILLVNVGIFAKWSWELCKEGVIASAPMTISCISSARHKTFYNVWNAASARSIISTSIQLFIQALDGEAARPGTVDLQKVLNCAHRLTEEEGGIKKKLCSVGLLPTAAKWESRHHPFKPQLWPTSPQKFLHPLLAYF